MTTTAFQHWSALHAWWCARQHEREAVGRQWAPRKTRTDVPATEGDGREASRQESTGTRSTGSPAAVVAAPGRTSVAGTTPVNDILPRHGMPQHALDELAVDRDVAARRASYQDWTAGKTLKAVELPLSPGAIINFDFVKHTTSVDSTTATFSNPPIPSPTLTPDPARQTLLEQRGQLNPNPSQGADLSDKEFDTLWAALKDQYDRLELPARAWRARLAKQAQRRSVTFLAQDAKTERVYWLNKAIVALALAEPRDDLLRILISPWYPDIAFNDDIEPGHLVGSLNAAQAERFAGIVDEYLAPPPAA